MKTYIKPDLNQINISANTEIASLNDWLASNSLTTYQDSITTFQYNS